MNKLLSSISPRHRHVRIISWLILASWGTLLMYLFYKFGILPKENGAGLLYLIVPISWVFVLVNCLIDFDWTNGSKEQGR